MMQVRDVFSYAASSRSDQHAYTAAQPSAACAGRAPQRMREHAQQARLQQAPGIRRMVVLTCSILSTHLPRRGFSLAISWSQSESDNTRPPTLMLRSETDTICPLHIEVSRLPCQLVLLTAGRTRWGSSLFLQLSRSPAETRVSFSVPFWLCGLGALQAQHAGPSASLAHEHHLAHHACGHRRVDGKGFGAVSVERDGSQDDIFQNVLLRKRECIQEPAQARFDSLLITLRLDLVDRVPFNEDKVACRARLRRPAHLEHVSSSCSSARPCCGPSSLELLQALPFNDDSEALAVAR